LSEEAPYEYEREFTFEAAEADTGPLPMAQPPDVGASTPITAEQAEQLFEWRAPVLQPERDLVGDEFAPAAPAETVRLPSVPEYEEGAAQTPALAQEFDAQAQAERITAGTPPPEPLISSWSGSPAPLVQEPPASALETLAITTPLTVPSPSESAAVEEPEPFFPLAAPAAPEVPREIEDLAKTSSIPELHQMLSSVVKNGSELSEEQLDRLATRVLEKLSDRVIREIAWEVIPELAEVVIKQRIKELESGIE
jgi:hypothetical protein